VGATSVSGRRRARSKLVVRGRDGKVETVAYQLLPPLLLAELQRQERRIERLEARLRR
jgi:hypothetical protein